MKNEDWLMIVRTKNEQRAEVSAPDDANRGALIQGLLHEFIRPAEKCDKDGKPLLGRKEDLLRGLPVAAKDSDTGENLVYFRGVDFITMLKRKRAEEFKGAELWSVLRKAGCLHDKIRVGHTVLQVWGYPFSDQRVELVVPKAKEDF
jgi:hypothetical protein